MDLAERIKALGDIALIIDQYFQSHSFSIHPSDSWNSAGFEADRINSDWGWYFQELPKPTIDDLEAIKASM